MSARQPRERAAKGESLVGARWTLEVGGVAHGGHCVARHEGRVVFVRHALPGERVAAVVTEGRDGDSFVRADAVEVLEASPDRVAAPCRFAGPGLCGGCDFQHVTLEAQRRLKADVVREQFARVAKMPDVDVEVRPVPGDADGLRWRTRVEFAVDAEGLAGLRAHRSREVVPVDDCLIATEGVIASGVLDTAWDGCASVDVIDAVHPDEPVLVPVPADDASGDDPSGRVAERGGPPSGGLVGELVRQGDWEGEYVVAARGFWQVHPGAASTFLSRVVDLLEAGPGDRVLDLYAGSGLFTMRLGELVEPGGFVLGVEGDAVAVANGERNTEHLPNVEWRAARVDRELRSLVRQGVTADLVVLDPPRTGAGKEVMALLAQVAPRRVVYVACDPAALARDVRQAAEHGYEMTSLEGWDAFPMTHHVECIAVLERRPA
ncbi:class I SAM-dependent RNA methyltransferase [Intrasporangium sp. YIM S08009]|uniref:class I SAM-dependent RNA methyltransferase n=1 Tax=Intrasporangium zincisolvens TaxID=3080018 RepID=UPI002B05871C|nr:TRAM domain-containing protein [Intrasporangium sp. YIM S08009]